MRLNNKTIHRFDIAKIHTPTPSQITARANEQINESYMNKNGRATIATNRACMDWTELDELDLRIQNGVFPTTLRFSFKCSLLLHHSYYAIHFRYIIGRASNGEFRLKSIYFHVSKFRKINLFANIVLHW